MKKPKTFKIIELGCPKSEVDSSWLAANLEERGLERVWEEKKPADIAIVNTCAFLQETKNTSLETLKTLKEKGASIVVAFGCLVEIYKTQAERYSDVTLGLSDFLNAYSALDALSEKKSFAHSNRKGALPKRLVSRSVPHRNYQYIKVADGCSNFCRYCRIPQIRGRFRSRPLKHILIEAEALVDAGIKELILVAQDTTRWGEDIYGKPLLERLLKELALVAKDRWIRLLYLHPSRVTKRLVELVASGPPHCKYLDIPIQHVSDSVLANMGRPHGVKNPRFIIEWVRKNFPGISLRTTVMAGYPDETERDFKILYNFCRQIEFDHLSVFPFSAEPKTIAANLHSQIKDEVKSARLAKLEELSNRLTEKRNRRLMGKEFIALRGVEPAAGDDFSYRTEFQAPEVDGITWVKAGGNKNLQDKIWVKISGVAGFDCFAEEAILPAQNVS